MFCVGLITVFQHCCCNFNNTTWGKSAKPSRWEWYSFSFTTAFLTSWNINLFQIKTAPGVHEIQYRTLIHKSFEKPVGHNYIPYSQFTPKHGHQPFKSKLGNFYEFQIMFYRQENKSALSIHKIKTIMSRNIIKTNAMFSIVWYFSIISCLNMRSQQICLGEQFFFLSGRCRLRKMAKTHDLCCKPAYLSVICLHQVSCRATLR